MEQPTWVQTLPEIIGTARDLLESEKWSDGLETDEKWAKTGRECRIGNLIMTEEGNADCGPYRLTVCAKSTEEDMDNWHEPLLKLEIRPSPWWVSSVRSALQEIMAEQVKRIIDETGL